MINNKFLKLRRKYRLNQAYLDDNELVKRSFQIIRYMPNFLETQINDFKVETFRLIRKYVDLRISNPKIIFDKRGNQYISYLIIPKKGSKSVFSGKVLKINEYNEFEDITDWAKDNFNPLIKNDKK